LFFDIGVVLRGLMKIGLNLIAASCPNTPVDRKAFSLATQIILGNGPMSIKTVRANGFVRAEDVQTISAQGNAHSFRLVHDGSWYVYMSFFGGKIGALVRIPGPNHEDWRCKNIVAPLNSTDWKWTTSRILPYLKEPRVEWMSGKALTPSLDLQILGSSVTLETVRKRNRAGQFYESPATGRP
jgi:hypothetical protein